MADSSPQAPARACDHVLALLKECLLRSDCVLKRNELPSTCLKEHFEELPLECKLLRNAHYECKRGLLDMRLRFRGNNLSNNLPLQDRHEVDAPDKS
ncbi:hypothetical protein M407DRAFT_242161 [Tulasnella calospora MUT 4182]|uniref:Cytochrome c oxidase assembly factor 5 n=1 Tax=Tulasnella calospora MUT 4182 TaxID=1051891 RepID=A0A0C3QQ22_9AGAM|nr:hypothetical protein M407DRAFT_242161 [Tulasnella calospora MUT 4182]